MTNINNILDERGSRYGDFSSNATTTQLIKQAINLGDTTDKLSFYQREALEMIAHKISRIVNGDGNSIRRRHVICPCGRCG